MSITPITRGTANARASLERDALAAAFSESLDNQDRAPLERLKPEHFITTSYRAIWRVRCEVRDADNLADLETVSNALDATGWPEGQPGDRIELYLIASEPPAVSKVSEIVTRLIAAADMGEQRAALMSAAGETSLAQEAVLAGLSPEEHLDKKRAHLERALAIRISTRGPIGEPIATAQFSPIEWTISPWLEAESVGLLVGEPKTGKTFTAVAMACAVASGRPFLDKYRTGEPAGVFYYAAEGRKTIEPRVRAWCSHEGLNYKEDLALFDIVSAEGMSLKIINPSDADEIIAYCKNRPKRLIVIDTLAMGGGLTDENSSGEAGLLMNQALRIAEETHATVLFVHHGTKAKPNDPRGSSALRGAVSFTLALKGPEALRLVLADSRNAVSGAEVGLRLSPNYETGPETFTPVVTRRDGLSSAEMDQAVLEVLEGCKPVTPSEIREIGEDQLAEISKDQLARTLSRLAKISKLTKSAGGKYSLSN